MKKKEEKCGGGFRLGGGLGGGGGRGLDEGVRVDVNKELIFFVKIKKKKFGGGGPGGDQVGGSQVGGVGGLGWT